MTEIKLTKRYPNSRTEDIVDAYMRGWNDALDAVQNGKFHIADTPQTDCETCKHYNPHHEAIACERCLDGKYNRYEPQTECRTCKWALVSWTSHHCDDCEAHNKYEPYTDCGWGKPND